MNRLDRFLIPIFTIALFTSCVKDEFEITELNTNAEPVFGVPLGSATVTAERLIAHFDSQGIVQEGSDGMLSVAYRDTFEVMNLADVFELGSQSIETSLDLTPLQLLTMTDEGEVVHTSNQVFPFVSDSGDRLDSLRLRTGVFELTIQSPGGYPISGVVELRSGDNTESIFTIAFEDMVPPINISEVASFENLLLRFSHANGVENALRLAHEITFFSSPDGVPAPVDIQLSLNNFSVQSVGGYIAQRTIPLQNQGLNITLFDDFPNGEFSIADPRIHLYTTNGFGMALAFDINQLVAFNTIGNSMIVDGDQIARMSQIDASPAPGISAFSTTTLTNENITPTITEILDFKPNYMTGDFSMALNPSDLPTAFLTDESTLSAVLELDIPIFGSISNFVSSDTTAAALGEIIKAFDDISEIESLDLRLFVRNGFPVDMQIQVIFLDSTGFAIDSIFTGPSNLFLSAPVELSVNEDHPNYGRANGVTETMTEIPIPRSRVAPLADVTQMVVKVWGNTTGNGTHPIRLFANDFFDIKLSAKTKISYQ